MPEPTEQHMADWLANEEWEEAKVGLELAAERAASKQQDAEFAQKVRAGVVKTIEGYASEIREILGRVENDPSYDDNSPEEDDIVQRVVNLIEAIEGLQGDASEFWSRFWRIWVPVMHIPPKPQGDALDDDELF